MTVQLEDIQITDAEITNKAKEIAKKQLLDDKRKLAERQAKIDAAKAKEAAAKARDAQLKKERALFLNDLPKFFEEKLHDSMLKNMERYIQNPELRWLDKLYKIAIIKRELLGGK